MSTLPLPFEPAQNSGTTSPFDALRRTDGRGEFWSARDLMTPLGYDSWRRFDDTVQRAILACSNSGADATSNFADAVKVAASGPAGADYRLTRYASYLVAMNGDPRKPEIAAAQTYFAVRTREAEVAQPAMPAIPQTMSEALRLAADQFDRAELAERKVAELAPAAESWNTLATAEGDFLVADAAKILSRDPAIKIGQNRLFTKLGELGWIYRAPGDQKWRTKQAAIETGRISEIPMTHYHPRTGALILDPPQIRVTVKGMEWLHQHLRGERSAA